MWILSNIAAGSHSQIQKLIDETGLIDQVMHLILTDHKDIVYEAAWTIKNICTQGSKEQLHYLTSCGALVALIHAADVGEQKMDKIVKESLVDHFHRTSASWHSPTQDVHCALHTSYPDMISPTKFMNTHPVSFTNVHGYQQVFRDDDPSELRDNVVLQIHAFGLKDKIKAIEGRGVDCSEILRLLKEDEDEDEFN